ncbi:hypothetical protein VTK56DRAFT_1718 [Thermocarpiscus australiensis]
MRSIGQFPLVSPYKRSCQSIRGLQTSLKSPSLPGSRRRLPHPHSWPNVPHFNRPFHVQSSPSWLPKLSPCQPNRGLSSQRPHVSRFSLSTCPKSVIRPTAAFSRAQAPAARTFSRTTKMAVSSGSPRQKHKVTVIGSGNWGTTVAKLVAENTREHPDIFEEDVQMWVYEEEVVIPADSPHYDPAVGDKPQKLTSVINKCHENVKYLPKIPLPTNVIANPSLLDAVKDSSILIFNLPHEFIGNVCKQIKGHILPFARGISCIKGVTVTDDKIELICEYIGETLEIYCGALSGANIANEIANEMWCETTIAYNTPPCDRRCGNGVAVEEHRDSRGQVIKTRLTPVPDDYPPLDHDEIHKLFNRPYFTVSMVSDVVGVSLGGALKNIVAIACGFVEGHGWNMTAKTAVMRRGMLEIIQFAREFFPETIQEKTFWEESAGWGDMIVSCTSARNWRYSKMAVERGVSIQEIERTELNGQKLQGISTSREVSSFLRARGVEDKYPLFKAVEGILDGKVKVEDIPRLFRK